ncbi:hypothetical protein PTKIN_Ptkin07bG0009900 [Pterospermum kingtungense]
MQLQPPIFTLHLHLFFFFLVGFVSADYLQNPSFESPPNNLTGNSTSAPFVLLNENNTIPGWTFQGTVEYVTAGQTIALPDNNGHGILLGQDGKLNQTFKADAEFMNYILTFTLAPGGQNCSANASVEVSGPDNQGVFSFKQHYGEETWQSYGLFLGLGGQEEPINLVFETQAIESDDNSTCWPVIGSLLVKSVETLLQGKDNLLQNGGFEFGPEFLSNSTQGILLDSALSPVQSPLRQWTVVGTIKYIDSKHFYVPQGNAAVEIVSGASTGIRTDITLTAGSSYNLNYTLGDANNGCEGDFIVEVQAGPIAQNFTVKSKGTGSAQKLSMKFEAAGSHATPISFISYATSQTKDGVFCGPVVDDVVLVSSDGPRIEIKLNILISLKHSVNRPPTPDGGEDQGKEPTLQEIINIKLIESGEKERLMELLRERLVECGWKDEMKALCRAYIKKKGRNNVTVDELVLLITPKGRGNLLVKSFPYAASIPDSIKAELLQKIRSFLVSTAL